MVATEKHKGYDEFNMEFSENQKMNPTYDTTIQMWNKRLMVC